MVRGYRNPRVYRGRENRTLAGDIKDRVYSGRVVFRARLAYLLSDSTVFSSNAAALPVLEPIGIIWRRRKSRSQVLAPQRADEEILQALDPEANDLKCIQPQTHRRETVWAFRAHTHRFHSLRFRLDPSPIALRVQETQQQFQKITDP